MVLVSIEAVQVLNWVWRTLIQGTAGEVFPIQRIGQAENMPELRPVWFVADHASVGAGTDFSKTFPCHIGYGWV
jgi:hypothetical protein